MSFSDISHILNKQMFQQKGLGQQIQASLICEEFDKIIFAKWGEKITRHVRALYFKDKILTIASLSSVASQEIHFAEIEIIEKINQNFGSKLIQKIRYLS
ncbi:MAG TPA: DUF721 domain-containing protein [bacterium]|nr:DUF721 domain-containing protein [bacterium]